MSDPVSQLRGAVSETAATLAGDGKASTARLDRPPRPDFGDYSTNAAMLLAPTLGEPPRTVAERLGDALGERLGVSVERVEIAGPGFLNLFMADAWYLDSLAGMREAGEAFGSGGAAPAERVNVEFVSANPTGPLHIGHTRNAAYGDALARILDLPRPRGHARVLRERLRLAGDALRGVAARPGARRGGVRGRLPGRLRRRAGRRDPGRGGDGAGAARPRRRGADDRPHARVAQALPCRVRRLVLGAHAAPGGRRARVRAARRAGGDVPIRGSAVGAHLAARRRQGPRDRALLG